MAKQQQVEEPTRKKEFDPENPFQDGPRLNRQLMDSVLDHHGAVLHKGQVITAEERHLLPTEAELAKGSSVAVQRTVANMEKQIAAMQAQMDALLRSVTGAGETTTAEPGPMPPLTEAALDPKNPPRGGTTPPDPNPGQTPLDEGASEPDSGRTHKL